MPLSAWRSESISTLFPYTTLFRSAFSALRHRRDRSVDRPAQGGPDRAAPAGARSEEHTSELQSLRHLVCLYLLGGANRYLHSFPTRRSSDLRSLRFDIAEIDQWIDQRKVARIEPRRPALDRKSTRLNSSHLGISYAFICLAERIDIYTLSLHDALPICVLCASTSPRSISGSTSARWPGSSRAGRR